MWLKLLRSHSLPLTKKIKRQQGTHAETHTNTQKVTHTPKRTKNCAHKNKHKQQTNDTLRVEAIAAALAFAGLGESDKKENRNTNTQKITQRNHKKKSRMNKKQTTNETLRVDWCARNEPVEPQHQRLYFTGTAIYRTVFEACRALLPALYKNMAVFMWEEAARTQIK